MIDVQTALEQIISRSSMIHERLSPSFTLDESQEPELAAARIEEWRQALDGDARSEILEKYMQWERLDEETLRRMVGHVRVAVQRNLPNWAETLGSALTLAQQPTFWQEGAPGWLKRFQERPEGGTDLEQERRQPFPFEELYPPFLEVYQDRTSAESGYELLGERARLKLWRKLLIDFAHLASEALYHDFRSFRDRQAFGPLAQLVAKSGKGNGRSIYQQYIRNMQAGGILTFFLQQPVLARLLGVTLHNRIQAHREFLQRLHDDQEQIARLFGEGHTTGKATDLQLSLSDLHREGRSVVAVTFESGLKIVYKPHNLGIGVAYNHLLTWLDAHGSPVTLHPLQHLDRGEYGWVEFARHEPCRDISAVGRYYRRVGALLCLMYALEATDCHLENLVACGEHPVLIDNETIFHHRVPEQVTSEIRESAIFKARMKLNHSCLQVGLLPGYNLGKDYKSLFDISGVGGEGDQIAPHKQMKFAFINTDAMQMVYEQGKIPQAANRPYLEGGVPVPMEDFIDDLGDGFRETYRFLMQKRREMLQFGGPMQGFNGRLARFIFRPTQIYVWLNDGARRLENLQDGADYSLYLERLARALLQLKNKPTWYPLLAAERQAMYYLDIPFFTASTDSADLETGAPGRSDTIRNYFTAPSYDLAVERLLSLSEEDLEFQSLIIQVSMRCRQAAQLQEKASQAMSTSRRQPRSACQTLDWAGLVAEAVALADWLERQAIRGEEDSVAWYGPQYLKEANLFQLNVLGISLFDGLAGVGLFLAALDKILRLPEHRESYHPSYRELALAAMKPVRSSLRGGRIKELVEKIGVGGAYGVGGLLYALARCAGFLEQPDLLDDAQAAVLEWSPDLVIEDGVNNLMDGLAGGMLGLLAVYQAARQPEALERAVDCGEHLLRKGVAVPSEPSLWTGTGGKPMAGFWDGVAGIAYALLRLHRETGDERFLSTAEEILTLVTSIGWKKRESRLEPGGLSEDRASGLERGNATVACRQHVVGISLGCLGNLTTSDYPESRQVVQAALQISKQTLKNGPDYADHLYGGNLGFIELLLAADRYLDRSDLTRQALQEASRLACIARREGGYRTTGFLKRGIYSPGFFLGVSGIGYQFLRLAYPRLLPNVLLWE